MIRWEDVLEGSEVQRKEAKVALASGWRVAREEG